jgi:ATP-dependent helicase HrpB
MSSEQQLPIYEIEASFREQMRTCGCAVVTAPTGSGKSTQLPKWLLAELPEAQRIIVLQPRRLAARLLAERVAWELGEQCGQRVGYLTRFERACSAKTRLLFVTEGVLTRMLLSSGALDDCGAVVFDEFHERTINADLGLAMVQHLRCTTRPDLKLVVMSATMDAAGVSAYLNNAPLLESHGRLYPVELSYTPHNDFSLYRNAANALSELLAAGAAGDVLIFMPGAGEIRRCIDEISARKYNEKLRLLPLYGEMSSEAQRAVFSPCEERKVIVATNIAETSLTIPGVRIVIDSGLVKLGRCESGRGVDILELTPCSRDAAAQRAGRAGREAPGICRRLWSAIEQDHRLAHTPPEIRRLDLADAILSVHCYGFKDDHAFPWFEAPPENGARDARALLQRLGLLASDGAVTELGRQIQRFPAHPRIALMLHEGAKHGCYELACGAAALIGARPLMATSCPREQLTALRNDHKRKMRQLNAPESDIIAQLQLVKSAASAHFAIDACERLGITASAARDIARDSANYLRMRPKDAGAESPDAPLQLSRVILRCFPDRLARRLDRGTLDCELAERRRAVLSERSLAREAPLLVAAEIRETTLKNRPGSVLELSLACGICEDWLWEDFADDLQENDEIFWDNAKQQVLRRTNLSCLGVTLEEKIRTDPEPIAAAELLCAQLEANATPLLGWDESCDHFVERVHFLAAHFPELELPQFDDAIRERVRRALCAGETKYSAVKNKPALPFIQSILTPKQLSAIQKLAPESLPLPRGRKLRITYQAGQPPKGRAKIQELYDVKGPLTVGDGRIPVLLDILAPNFRTVQITDNLPRFWEVHYPALKSQLARRYPKHEWR